MAATIRNFLERNTKYLHEERGLLPELGYAVNKTIFDLIPETTYGTVSDHAKLAAVSLGETLKEAGTRIKHNLWQGKNDFVQEVVERSDIKNLFGQAALATFYTGVYYLKAFTYDAIINTGRILYTAANAMASAETTEEAFLGVGQTYGAIGSIMGMAAGSIATGKIFSQIGAETFVISTLNGSAAVLETVTIPTGVFGSGLAAGGIGITLISATEGASASGPKYHLSNGSTVGTPILYSYNHGKTGIPFYSALFLSAGACAFEKYATESDKQADLHGKPHPKDCINFSKAENETAYQFYSALSESISCRQMDEGYIVFNYDGKQCPNSGEQSCLVGAQDGIVEAPEVIDFVLNREGRYQALTKNIFKSPPPWMLDDLNPDTFLDVEVRRRVEAAISHLQWILAKQEIPAGTEAYKQKLAVGLFSFVITHDTGIVKDKGEPDFNDLNSEGLGEFRNYLIEHGGLGGMQTDYSEERSALEAIQSKRGKCTEHSKVLFAVFRLAGLQPQFVFVESSGVKSTKLEVQKYLDSLPAWMEHMCIGLQIDDKFRLFDPSLHDSNAPHDSFYPLTLRQYLSLDYSNRATNLFWKGQLNKARENFTKAIEIDPKNAVAYYNRGIVWFKKGELDKAILDYDRALALNPKHDSAYNNRGYTWQQKGDLDKALADFTRAIEINPRNDLAYYSRGIVLTQKGEVDEAILDYNKAIELNPKYDSAYNNRGLTWLQKGDLNRALTDFNKAIEINPRNVGAYRNRAVFRFQTGVLDEALADLTKAIEIDPQFAEGYYNRGVVWSEKGEIDKAISDYTKAIQINPKYAMAYNNRGQDWAQKGDLDKAIADFTKAIQFNSQFSEAHVGMGLALAEKGETAKAIEHFAVFFQLNPDVIDPLLQLLIEKLTSKWSSTPYSRKISNEFKQNTNGFDIGKFEAIVVLSYGLWQANHHRAAREIFTSLSNRFGFKQMPTLAVSDFLTAMLNLMPPIMSQDEEVKRVIKKSFKFK